jgi:hypothetical protein
MGPTRFTVWGVYRVFCPINCLGSIYFKGQKVDSKQAVDALDEHNFSPDLPELTEEAKL